MTKGKWQKVVRKSHRYLGLFLGIQFLFWTIGGLYFSWTNIKNIRGEDIRKEPTTIKKEKLGNSLNSILNEISKTDSVYNLKSVQIATIFDTPYYQITFNNGKRIKTVLANTSTNQIKFPISKSEAILIAKNSLNVKANIKSVEYIISTNGHHEYREKPLPAYAVSFDGDVNTTVYVSEELGTIQTYRNNQWRVFDFLWMLHVMDYQNRDNINNWLLRLFSVIGLITIASGFLLFGLTQKVSRKQRS
jgi:hypothetical protein